MKTKKMIGMTALIALVMFFSVSAFAQLPGLKKMERQVKDAFKTDRGSATPGTRPAIQGKGPISPTASSQVLYVSITKGSNKNEGSQTSPVKEIDKAVQMAEPGAQIKIAGGMYRGTFNIGFIESNKPLRLYGSYDENFTRQDIATHPTVFQPDNEVGGKNRKALLRFTKDIAGTVIDGIVWDMGERNAYSLKEGFVKEIEGGRLLLPTESSPTGNPTADEACIQFMTGNTGGDVTIQNCVFVNGANFAIQAGHRSGKFTVRNNVFVANRMAAVEVFGTCAGSNQNRNMTLCGEVEVAYNTILFTWSRLKDFQDMGYGVRIMTKCGYDIHHNIIGGAVLAAIDHSRFTKNEWIKIVNNIFFVNKRADLYYTPASNTHLNIRVAQFDDLDIAS
ncbi:MAG: right-handed parallel beta-helix repeat-containing protein, partial [Syntrophales bacterium]|nr:right-handed parallel beta-helix repeat-containing protein [Syntrophales bacterium]